jgi:hypothetical protein
MAWAVEASPQFEAWFAALTAAEQGSVRYSIRLLQHAGPTLARPHADRVKASRHANMKELRVQHAGRPYRLLFAFDPRRTAIVLLGGDKTGDGRWYARMVPLADDLYDAHLAALKEVDDEAVR